MNMRTTVIVLIIALLLGVYFLLFETDWVGWRRQTTQERERQLAEAPPAEGVPVFGSQALSPGQITRLRIEKSDGPAITARREADSDQWNQIEPVNWPLQAWSMDQLINNAAGLRYTSTVDPAKQGMDLPSLGLKPALVTIELSGDADATDGAFEHRIYLGNTIAAGRAYAMVDDQPTVFVVSDGLYNQLVDEPLTSLRRKGLTSVDSGQAQRIALQRAGEPTIELTQAEGRWRLRQPVQGPAASAQVEALTGAFGSAWVRRFVADNPQDLAPYGLAEPAAVLTVDLPEPADPTDAADTEAGQQAPATTQPSRQRRLVIGQAADVPGETFFAMVDQTPVVFTVAESTKDTLTKDPMDLRQKTICAAPTAQINEVKITREGNTQVHLRRESGIWAFAETDPGYAVDAQAVDSLLKALTETEAVEGRIADSDQPESAGMSVTIGIATRSEPRIVHVEQINEQQVLVTGAGETYANVMDRGELEPLFATPLFYRDRTVWNISPEQVQSIRLVRTGQHPADHLFQRGGEAEAAEPGPWQLESFDRDAFDRLLAAITPLRAEQWLVEPKMYIPEGVTLHIELFDGTKRRLTIHPGAAEAEISDADLPFAIDRELVEAAMAEFGKRTVFDYDIDQIDQVMRGEVTVERDEQAQYHRVGGQDADLATGRVGAMFDTLAGLQARRWLGGGAFDPTHELVITTSDQRTHTLKLAANGARPIGQLDDGALFLLDDEAMAALTADLLREPQK